MCDLRYFLLFQYVPLPIFFAEDNLSFYHVMSDTQGYKHIHYVKDVSIFSYNHTHTHKNICLVTLIRLLVLSVLFILRVFHSGQSRACYLREVGSHLHIETNKRRPVSDDAEHFWEHKTNFKGILEMYSSVKLFFTDIMWVMNTKEFLERGIFTSEKNFYYYYNMHAG